MQCLHGKSAVLAQQISSAQVTALRQLLASFAGKSSEYQRFFVKYLVFKSAVDLFSQKTSKNVELENSTAP